MSISVYIQNVRQCSTYILIALAVLLTVHISMYIGV